MPSQTKFYLPHNRPSESVKPVTLVFYGPFDADEAVKLAGLKRGNGREHVMLRDCAVYWGEEEICDAVWIMPSVPVHHRSRIVEIYRDKILALTEADIEQVKAPKPAAEQLPETPRPKIKKSVDYYSMTNKELKETARQQGVALGNVQNKEQIIARLMAAGR